MLFRSAYTKVGVGYNIQIAVDAKNKMVVEQAVTNQVVDMDLLTQTAEPARAILDVETIGVVADRGYFKIEDIEACEKAGLTPHVPKPQRGSSVRKGLFRKDEFRYDPDRDVYICPAGETLSPNHESKLRDLKKIDYSNPAARPACPLRSRCTTNLPGLASGERGGARPHGSPTEGEARDSRSASRDRRASLRQHQAVDEPGRLLDEGPRKRARRVQPHGARLQFATGPQHPWRRGHDGGGPGLKGAILALLNHADDARVITTGILRQNPEKVAETSSGEVSPLNWSRFHTVCLVSAPFRAFRRLSQITEGHLEK